MVSHGVTPTPEHYAVWLAYHAGTRPDLRAAIDKVLNNGRSLDDHLCSRLHEEHLAEMGLSERVLRAGENFAAEMHDVVEGLKSAKARTNAYGAQLQQARRDLASAADPRTMQGVVEGLVHATGEMADQSRVLEERLNATNREVQSLRDQLQKVQVEASTDALTGVANRKVFETKLAEMARASDVTGQPMALIMADIDLFKQVNDTWGHQTGDQVIRFVATVMQRHATGDALVARLGGEEFALLAPCDTAKARAIAESIRTTVEGKRLVRRSSNEDLGRITVSLGFAVRERRENADSLIERTDAALYASKRGGRNRATLADRPRVAAA